MVFQVQLKVFVVVDILQVLFVVLPTAGELFLQADVVVSDSKTIAIGSF